MNTNGHVFSVVVTLYAVVSPEPMVQEQQIIITSHVVFKVDGIGLKGECNITPGKMRLLQSSYLHNSAPDPAAAIFAATTLTPMSTGERARPIQTTAVRSSRLLGEHQIE